ncbi:MAG TPA: hypothetical protein VMJ34_17680 [Bryobacteraceae bacterium]|nr:hypothetical protein [Bryobacteraceae bacterium]
MAVTVKSIELWRTEVENTPGTLASVLAPLAEAGVDLQLCMGYRYPGNEAKAAIEVFPIKGKKAVAAAASAGLKVAAIPTLLIEGDNRPGLGRAIAQALAAAGVNLDFFVAQSLGRRFSAAAGFKSPEGLKQASPLVKKAAGVRKKR